MMLTADFSEFTDSHQHGETAEAPTDRERWWAAVSYLFIGCFIPLLLKHRTEYVRFHLRQGFTLFFAECIGFLIILIIHVTLGQLPFLGLLILILARLIVYLAALSLSVFGFVKALFGERWSLPILGDYSHHIPI